MSSSIFRSIPRYFNIANGCQSIWRATAARSFCTRSCLALPRLLPARAAAGATWRHPSRRGFAAAATPGGGAAGNIVSIQDDADYEKRVRASQQPVVLQFHATWCAPCKLLKPRLEKAVRDKPKLLLATVDVDELPDLAAEFRVTSVPMVLALREGRVVDSFVGLREPEAVQDFVDKFCEKQGL